jgi:hypothetical protein
MLGHENSVGNAPESQGFGGPDESFFFTNYPQPPWIQVDNLGLGDVLVVRTQSSYYHLFVTGHKVGVLFGTKEPQGIGEVHIYGSYDLETQQPAFGRIQVGLPLLFAPLATPSDATKTSPIQTMYLRKATHPASLGYGISQSSNRPMVSSPSVKAVQSVKPSIPTPLGKSPTQSPILKPTAKPLISQPPKPLIKPPVNQGGGVQPVRLVRS